MNFIKMLVIAFGLVILGMLAFSVFGFLYSIIWYLFWIGAIGFTGFVGYKMLTKDKKTSRLEGKTPISFAAMRDYKRALKEYKD
jgi:hypothetical protein